MGYDMIFWVKRVDENEYEAYSTAHGQISNSGVVRSIPQRSLIPNYLHTTVTYPTQSTLQQLYLPSSVFHLSQLPLITNPIQITHVPSSHPQSIDTHLHTFTAPHVHTKIISHSQQPTQYPEALSRRAIYVHFPCPMLYSRCSLDTSHHRTAGSLVTEK